MKYGTYNEELGYSNGPEFDNAFDAIRSASDKCRRHTVWEYDDEGHYLRTLSYAEQDEIWNREAAKAPADHRHYLFHAATPLMDDEAHDYNSALVQVFKDIADKHNVAWGGHPDDAMGTFYAIFPGKKDMAIGIKVSLSLPLEVKAEIDRAARDKHCSLVRTYNKYHRLVCDESYSEE